MSEGLSDTAVVTWDVPVTEYVNKFMRRENNSHSLRVVLTLTELKLSSAVCCCRVYIVLQGFKLANVNWGLLRLRRKTTHQSGLTHFAITRVWFLRSCFEITVCTRRKIRHFRNETKEENKFMHFMSSSRWHLRFYFSSIIIICSLHIIAFCGMTTGWLICVRVVFGLFLQGIWRKNALLRNFFASYRARMPNMRPSDHLNIFSNTA
jgi:hypothetical protein